MPQITTYNQLQEAIQLLELEQTEKSRLLKEQLNISYESLKPLNLLRVALKDMSSAPGLGDNLLGAAAGFASGYLSKKIFIGSSGSLLRNLIGSVLQFGVTNIVTRHPEAFRTFAQFIKEHLVKSKETKNPGRVR